MPACSNRLSRVTDTGKAKAMQRDGEGRGRGRIHGAAANDNTGSGAPGPGPGQAGPGGGAQARIDDAVMRLARLIGRQIAREQFDRPEAANDNRPAGEAGER